MLCSEANRFAIEIALLKHTPEGSACAARPREIAHVSTAEIRRIEIAAWRVHTPSMIRSFSKILSPAIALCWLSSSLASTPRPIAELAPVATIKLGETADWVAITADAVWVASTGPFAVHHIDPKTNSLAASVILPGEPCAGLAVGAGSLWVPMCTTPPSLAKVNLKTSQLTAVFAVGPAAAEGGIAYGAGSVWLIVDKLGALARLDPARGTILDTYRVPAGSYNPAFSNGTIWVSHAEGSDVTGIDAATGKTTATVTTGPNPRFLTAGAGAIWTLNQGDGTVTRVDVRSKHAAAIAASSAPCRRCRFPLSMRPRTDCCVSGRVRAAIRWVLDTERYGSRTITPAASREFPSTSPSRIAPGCRKRTGHSDLVGRSSRSKRAVMALMRSKYART
jgi:streptogramin lyase